ncbi:DNA cytosine methyltransferase [Archangium sp. Cb G35]|uniref:DNA cytosine methyltransferase n=1 Tax=Archangium sp. Cb G35 TaxID=1920190 RepID=UPI0009FAE0CA|nr:DNA cytosine methyltransferase [Archangium sp. Cb G35]
MPRAVTQKSDNTPTGEAGSGERIFTALEICAGGGGQALGLEQAGFLHAGVAEIDESACATLLHNRPDWNVLPMDIRALQGKLYRGIDLLAGGVPCPPFSIAGKQLGHKDERDLFPEALRLVEEAQPKAVMLENVKGFSSEKFADYRERLKSSLNELGYAVEWRVLNASDYGVPQLRPRFVLVALRRRVAKLFRWPEPVGAPPTVADTIGELIAARGWPGAQAWREKAQEIAPTLVGGSKKHGGPDLGPTRAKQKWLELGVDAMGVANEPPGPDHPIEKPPRLTVQMVARLQGFPADWQFVGGKTAAYRQVGNAFPPPVAGAVAKAIITALKSEQLKIPLEDATKQQLMLLDARRKTA